MITVHPGSHMSFLLSLLSVSGEFPCKSLGIFGDVYTVKAMIHKMEAVQKIRLSNGDSLKIVFCLVLRDLKVKSLSSNSLTIIYHGTRDITMPLVDRLLCSLLRLPENFYDMRKIRREIARKCTWYNEQNAEGF